MIDDARARFPEAALTAYATSFGGYLFLKYMAEHGNPFEKAAFRCPAVPMYQVLMDSIVDAGEARLLEKGKDVLVGFDRKIRIGPAFPESLRQADLNAFDFTAYGDDIIILHGTKDEMIPIDLVQDFAENNVIEFVPVEGANHPFQNPNHMALAIHQIIEFFHKGD